MIQTNQISAKEPRRGKRPMKPLERLFYKRVEALLVLGAWIACREKGLTKEEAVKIVVNSYPGLTEEQIPHLVRNLYATEEDFKFVLCNYEV